MTRCPVHDGDEIEKAALDRDVGDVGTPDMIGPVYLKVPQQIRVNPVFRAGIAGSRGLIDRLKPHQSHQAANPVTAHRFAFAPKSHRIKETAPDHFLRARLTNDTARRPCSRP